jgi:hypothetical protein
LVKNYWDFTENNSSLTLTELVLVQYRSYLSDDMLEVCYLTGIASSMLTINFVPTKLAF